MLGRAIKKEGGLFDCLIKGLQVRLPGPKDCGLFDLENRIGQPCSGALTVH